MNTTVLDNRVSVRIFVGVNVNPELRSHLNHSLPWKQALILRSTDSDVLIETHYENKTYVGVYLDGNQVTLFNLKALQQKIRHHLREYCPKLIGIDRIPIYVFPQIFVS